MSRPPKPPGDDFPVIFNHELHPAKRGMPVVAIPYLRGVHHRATVRVLPSLKAALKKHAPGCSTTALIALSDKGLHELLKSKQTLHSHVVADGKGGHMIHMLTPTLKGMLAVHCGKLPGVVPHDVVSMPGPLSDAMKRHSTAPWVAVMALADWQLGILVRDKMRLTSTPTAAIADEAVEP
jgi:hypothetical protein